MTLLEFANYYTGRKLPVVPIAPRDKRPALPSWAEYQQRLPTEDQLLHWFDNTENNIGIVCGPFSGIAVVDLDSEEAVDFVRQNNFPHTPMVKTAKGFHLYYKYHEGIGNSVRLQGISLDIRGKGGLVVAPPSIHATGHHYQWVEGFTLEDLPLAEFPHILSKTQPPKVVEPIPAPIRGVPEGMRNDTLARLVGTWIRGGLTLNECLANGYVWNKRNTPPLPDEEVVKTVTSIYQRNAQNMQQGGATAFQLTKLDSLLLEEDEETVWVVEGLIPTASLSGIVSKPKVGKTTLTREMAFRVANGESFLGRNTLKGPVICLYMEEKRGEVRRHFRDMGATEEDVYIHAGSIPGNAISHLEKFIEDIKPALVIIDPIYRFLNIRDANDYTQVLKAVDPLLQLARSSGASILIVHHSVKADRPGGDQILGSTGLLGSLDTAILLTRKNNERIISTIQRYGADLQPSVLSFDLVTRTSSIHSTQQQAEERSLETQISQYLAKQTSGVAEKTINENVKGDVSLRCKALRTLLTSGAIERIGKGRKGDPYLYSTKKSNPIGSPSAQDEELDTQSEEIPANPFLDGWENSAPSDGGFDFEG